MVATIDQTHSSPLHPIHAVLLSSTVPLFLGALLSDIAYSNSYQVQWTNFASWLIVGGLVFTVAALLWALIGLLRIDRRGGRRLAYFLLLLGTFVLAFANALVHARDAWASMPAGLILSALVLILALAAVWTGFSRQRAGEAK